MEWPWTASRRQSGERWTIYLNQWLLRYSPRSAHVSPRAAAAALVPAQLRAGNFASQQLPRFQGRLLHLVPPSRVLPQLPNDFRGVNFTRIIQTISRVNFCAI